MFSENKTSWEIDWIKFLIKESDQGRDRGIANIDDMMFTELKYKCKKLGFSKEQTQDVIYGMFNNSKIISKNHLLDAENHEGTKRERIHRLYLNIIRSYEQIIRSGKDYIEKWQMYNNLFGEIIN